MSAQVELKFNPPQEIPGLQAGDERGFSKREGAPDFSPSGSTKGII